MTGPGDAAKEACLVSGSSHSCSPQPTHGPKKNHTSCLGGCFSASLMLGKEGGSCPQPWTLGVLPHTLHGERSGALWDMSTQSSGSPSRPVPRAPVTCLRTTRELRMVFLFLNG